MSNPLTVIVVEDEPEECEAFDQYFERLEDVRLVSVTNNADMAFSEIKDHIPDTIILDLELHKGGGNGLALLQALNTEHLSGHAYILVTTNNISSITHEQVRKLGADFVMVKSQGDYSAESVVELLRLLKGSIQDSYAKKSIAAQPVDMAPNEKKKRLRTRVSTEIDMIGISPKAVGRDYLIDYILFRIGDLPHGITEIALKYGKSVASVERAMQNAINRAWATMATEVLLLYYTAHINPVRGVPTLTEFVYYYADKIKSDYLCCFKN